MGEFLVNNLIGILGSSVIAYFVKKSDDQVTKRMDDLSERVKTSEQAARHELANIQTKVGGILDIMLEKFSKWEDRVNDILSGKMPDGINDNEEALRELSVETSELKADVLDIREDMNEINATINTVRDTMGANRPLSKKGEDYILQQLKMLSRQLDKMERNNESKHNGHNKLINGSYKVMKHFNSELTKTDAKLKIIERKVRNG